MNDLIFSIFLTNYKNEEFTNEDLMRLLKEQGFDVKVFEFVPTPGIPYASMDSWKIVTKASSIVSILGFLWIVYSEIIKPETKQKAPPGIHINIENLNYVHPIWIGGYSIQTKEQLDELLKSLKITDSVNDKRFLEILEKLNSSTNWQEKK